MDGENADVREEYLLKEENGVQYGELKSYSTRYFWHADGWLETTVTAMDDVIPQSSWWTGSEVVDTATFYAANPVDKEVTTITIP